MVNKVVVEDLLEQTAPSTRVNELKDSQMDMED
jgi:hypothetical protein